MNRLWVILFCFLAMVTPLCAQDTPKDSESVTVGVPQQYLFVGGGVVVGTVLLAFLWLFVFVPYRRRGPLRKALVILAANDAADFPEAEKLLSGVLTVGLGVRDIKVARFSLAYARARQRKYPEAAAVLADLKETGPLDRESLYLEVWLQHRLKNYEQVEEIFEERCEILGDMLDASMIQAIALLKRARTHWQRREFEKAIHAFEKIRKLEVLADEIPPQLDSHQIVMGMMALRERDFIEARKCFDIARTTAQKDDEPTYHAELGLLLCAWNNRAESGWSKEHDEQLADVVKVLPKEVEAVEEEKDEVKNEDSTDAADESLDKKLDEATLLIRNVRFWHAMSLLQTCFYMPTKQGLEAVQRKNIIKRLGIVSKIDPEMPDPYLVAGLVSYYFAKDDDERSQGIKNLRKGRVKGVNLPEVLTLLVRIDKAEKFEQNRLPAYLAFVKRFLTDQSVPPFLRDRLKKYFEKNQRFKSLGEVNIEKGDEDPLGWLGNLQGRYKIVEKALQKHLKPGLEKAKADESKLPEAEALAKKTAISKAEAFLISLPKEMTDLSKLAQKVEETQAELMVITAQVVFPEEETRIIHPVMSPEKETNYIPAQRVEETRAELILPVFPKDVTKAGPKENPDKPPEAFKFTCSHCQKELRVKAEYAGKKVKCNSCNNVILIPTR